MYADLQRIALIALLTPVLFSSGSAMAAKAKFERTKPHVNVGSLGHQGVSILVSNLRSNRDDAVPCDFSGELVATDNTPDRAIVDDVLRVHITLAEGESLSVPIPYPVAGSADGPRREIDVEINPDETSDLRCSIAMAVVGYDTDTEATQYASSHRVTKIDSFGIKQAIVPRSFLGFAGGNGSQVARVILTRFDAAEEEILEGRNCDYSGALLVQGMPIIDADHNETHREAYPVQFVGPGFKSVDVPLARFGATDDERVDVVLSYVVDSGPLAPCGNRLDINVQVVDPGTGATHTNETTRIPAHTPEWSNPASGDPG